MDDYIRAIGDKIASLSSKDLEELQAYLELKRITPINSELLKLVDKYNET